RHPLSAAQQTAARGAGRLRVAGVRRRTAAQVLRAHCPGQSAARGADRVLERHQRDHQPAGTVAMQKVITINLNGNAYQLDKGDTATHKRLYQIREGAMLSGVCKGLAAYFNIDVTIVRIVFIALAVLTKGAFIIAYVVLMCVIPYATTSEEHAAAHGQPFNAQELIDEAKRSYAGFKNKREWQRHWRRQQREWRRHVPPTPWRVWGAPPMAPVGYAGQVFAGVMMPLLTVARTAAFWIWLCVLASLLSTN